MTLDGKFGDGGAFGTECSDCSNLGRDMPTHVKGMNSIAAATHPELAADLGMGTWASQVGHSSIGRSI